MAPEFASNVDQGDNIPVSIIRLRPRVKLGTRNRLHLLVHAVNKFLRSRNPRQVSVGVDIVLFRR